VAEAQQIHLTPEIARVPSMMFAIHPRSYTECCVRLHSMSLAGGRRVTVYTPTALRARRRRYPLLLLHDGQNVFEPARAFVEGQHWRAGETADALVAKRLIPPIMICAIDHAGPDRMLEMTPTPGPN